MKGLIIFFNLNILIAEGLAVKTTSDALNERMRAQIEAERYNKRFICQGELVCGVSIIPIFYRKRGFKPARCGKTGVFKLADALLEAIRESTRERLRPSDYHLMRLEALVAEFRQKQSDKQPLKETLQRYRHIAIQGGWPVLPSKASWHKGDYGARFYCANVLSYPVILTLQSSYGTGPSK
jgi:hypothetical protein